MQLSAALVDKLRGASRRTTSVGLLCVLIMGCGAILNADTEQQRPLGPETAGYVRRGLQIKDDAEELQHVDADFEEERIKEIRAKRKQKRVGDRARALVNGDSPPSEVKVDSPPSEVGVVEGEYIVKAWIKSRLRTLHQFNYLEKNPALLAIVADSVFVVLFGGDGDSSGENLIGSAAALVMSDLAAAAESSDAAVSQQQEQQAAQAEAEQQQPVETPSDPLIEAARQQATAESQEMEEVHQPVAKESPSDPLMEAARQRAAAEAQEMEAARQPASEGAPSDPFIKAARQRAAEESQEMEAPR